VAATTSLLLLEDDKDDDNDDNDDDYYSCYGTLPPTPSAAEPPTVSAAVKSCEDWLAGIPCDIPEIDIDDAKACPPADVDCAGDDVGASLASQPSEPTPYSTPMSSVLLLPLDEPVDILPPSSPSNLTVHITRPTAADLPSTTRALFASALDGELAFLAAHQPSAARCFNNNMLRLAQAGLADEVPCGARPAAARWGGYATQLHALHAVVGAVGRQAVDRLVLGRVGCDAADVLVLLEDDAHGDGDGEERVRVTGVVDWEFAGVVPLWMVAGLPDFLRCSSSALPDGSDDEQHEVDGSGDGVLPVWVDDATDTHSCGWVLPRAMRDGDPLACVWRETLRDGDDDDDAWARDELVRAAWRVANVEWHEVQRACAWARAYLHQQHQDSKSKSSSAVASQLNERGDVPSDGEYSSGGRSRATDETDETLATIESAMPATPTGDAVPLPPSTAPSAAKHTEGPWSFAGVFVRAGLSDEEDEEDDEEDEDEEDEEEQEEEEERDEEGELHDWRDEFERAFLSPAPACRSTTTTLCTRTTTQQKQQKQKQKAEERKRERQAFEKRMNDPRPLAGYESLWAEPPEPTVDDLDFLVERDLDAGW
jgi:hypothetical protein